MCWCEGGRSKFDRNDCASIASTVALNAEILTASKHTVRCQCVKLYRCQTLSMAKIRFRFASSPYTDITKDDFHVS
ncbi:hypothetical protein J6590_085524 [Homalodisca vitripennis]|nr:hypothetical protein J6590_085524 [Homalodisca vitripennis]